MEISLPAELEKELDDRAALTGCSRHELVADAVASYLNELTAVRELLDQRYGEIEAGGVELIDGEVAFRRLLR